MMTAAGTLALIALVAAVSVVVVLFVDLGVYLRAHHSERWWYRNTKGSSRRLGAVLILGAVFVLAGVAAIVLALLALVIG